MEAHAKDMADPLTCRHKKRSVEPFASVQMSVQIGYYNIGWNDSQLSGANHEMHRRQLGKDCARAFEVHDLGVLRLCEVGTSKLDQNEHANLGNSAGFQKRYGEQNVENGWSKSFSNLSLIHI